MFKTVEIKKGKDIIQASLDDGVLSAPNKLGKDVTEVEVDGKTYKVLDSKVLDHEDIYFGKTKILKDKLVISIKNSPFKALEVSYQGCSEQGFCYPIQKVNIS